MSGLVEDRRKDGGGEDRWIEERMGHRRVRQGRVEEWREGGKRGWKGGKLDRKHI